MASYAMKPAANPTGGKLKLSVGKLISPVGRGITSPDISSGKSSKGGRKFGGR